MEDLDKMGLELDESYNEVVRMLKRSIKVDKILVVLLVLLVVFCITIGIHYMRESDTISSVFYALISALNSISLYFTIKRLFERCVNLEVVKILYDFSGEIKSKIEIDIETK